MPKLERTVIRCSGCELFQFVPQNGLCRKCSHDLRQQVTPPERRITAGAPEKIKIAPIKTETLAEAFGNTLRVLRQSVDASQKDLAKVMGAQRTYISKVERAATMPSIPQIKRLADALGIPAHVYVAMAMAK